MMVSRLQEPVSPSHWIRTALLHALLCLAVMASAVSVIYVSHQNRQVFATYQALLGQRDELKVDWGRLLLEESALAAHSRVEQIASNKLGMQVPETRQVVLVRP